MTAYSTAVGPSSEMMNVQTLFVILFIATLPNLFDLEGLVFIDAPGDSLGTYVINDICQADFPNGPDLQAEKKRMRSSFASSLMNYSDLDSSVPRPSVRRAKSFG